MKRKKYDNLAFPFTSFLQESQAVLFLIIYGYYQNLIILELYS